MNFLFQCEKNIVLASEKLVKLEKKVSQRNVKVILYAKERIMYVVKTMLTWVINGSGLPKVGGGRS